MLAELEERAAALRRRLAELNREAERWKNERDRLNESVRTLRTEALKHKEERDRANRQVAEIKRRIEAHRGELDEKRGKLAELEAGLAEERRRLPSRQRLEARLKRIEWEMATTPTSEMLDREDAFLEEARELRSALAAHEELDAKADERLTLLADIKATELEIRGCRDDISRLHEASEESHGKMLLLHRKADEERGRADEAHAKFLEYLSEIRRVNDEFRTVLGEIRGIRERLRALEQQEAASKKRMIDARKRELIREARRKLEAGEKLSLDELKLFYGEEEAE